MTSKKRSHRLDKLARIYDAEVLPIWSQRFGKMLVRGVTLPERGQLLDASCGTGYPATELIRKMKPDTRLIAIDGASSLLDVARRKVEEMGAKGVFFRTESIEPKLSFTDDVYDLVISNLGLSEVEDRQRAVNEFARVTKPGGQVRCTLPVEGTFQEFHDIYREVLTKHDKHDTLARLGEHIAAAYPPVAACESWFKIAGLIDVKVEVEEFSMLFRSSRESFFAPVIEYGPLAAWKKVAGKGQEMQDVFWYIKEAIDAYFEGRAFEITVKAACLSGRKPLDDDEELTGRVELADEVTGLVVEPAAAATEVVAAASTTEELELVEMVETLDGAVPIIEEEMEAEEIEALAEGAERPSHLDEQDVPTLPQPPGRNTTS
jgi:ubiquinone/menaquinone biosynthesis C-methylase UbiE